MYEKNGGYHDENELECLERSQDSDSEIIDMSGQ